MSEHGTITKSGATANPNGIFTLTSDDGIICDLTNLIVDGAKLTVLFIQLCHVWRHRGHTGDWVYTRLYRACISWEKAGYVTISRNVHDTNSVELTQRPGLYVRAVTALLD